MARLKVMTAVLVLFSALAGGIVAHADAGQARTPPYDFGCGPAEACPGPLESRARDGYLDGAYGVAPCFLYGPPFVCITKNAHSSSAGIWIDVARRVRIGASALVEGSGGASVCLNLRWASGGGYRGYGCVPLGPQSQPTTTFEDVELRPGRYGIVVRLEPGPAVAGLSSAIVRRISYTLTDVGPDTPASSSVPVTVAGMNNASVIAGGPRSTCAVRSTGAVACWGSGRLGNGPWSTSRTPADVGGLTAGSSIAIGFDHTCVLRSDRRVSCWGTNTSGQLGNGGTTESNVPVLVQGLTGVVSVSAGDSHTCALLDGGTIRCWGGNASGQLGSGGSYGSSISPVEVAGLSGGAAVAAGYAHTCALLQNGTIRCWGAGGAGQLGHGAPLSSRVPVEVRGITGATAVTAGPFHTCAVLADGSARCWGDNSAGQLGVPSTPAPTPLPVRVSGLEQVSSLAAGWSHTCARTQAGVKCWGSNREGQLGDGTFNSSYAPVPVTGLAGVSNIAAGWNHTCAVLPGGQARCWGRNHEYQLGSLPAS